MTVAPALRRKLLDWAAEDARVREELAAEGRLHEGYHPRMEAVHRANARRLEAVMDRQGWPTESRVGADGAEAAWRIAQHAIGEPALQRRCLAELQRAAAAAEAPAWQAAMLEDRIRCLEGRPQRYGTQLEPDECGAARPCPIEAPETVEDRRRAVGLEPLAERLAREPRIPLPADRDRFEHERLDWLQRVGWRP